MQDEYAGDAFVLGFSGASDDAYLLRFMEDEGEDLLHLELTKEGDSYTMTSRIIANGFINPVDAEIVGNKIYVVEHKNPQWLNNFATTRVWEVTFPGMGTSVDGRDEIAQNVQLNQNYPNPFNPTTVIGYQLPESSDVTLEVFDMLGRSVAVLVDGRQSAGSHQAEFDASNLSSGVYLYRLSAGQTVQTRQMVLVK